MSAGYLRLAHLEFHGGAREGWGFSGLDDWLSLTAAKSSGSSRPLAHGSFDPGRPWREAAAFSVKVHYLGSTQEEAVLALRDLTALGAYTSLIEATADVGDGRMTRRVQVANIDIPDTRGSDTVEATVYMLAPDPFAYGAEIVQTVGVPVAGEGVASPFIDPFQEVGGGNPGRVTVTNAGSAPTTVRIDIAGGVEGVQVQVVETGEVLRFDRLIPDGAIVQFDSRTGRATLDGQSDVTGFMVYDDWPQIPPQATRTFQFTPLGAVAGTPTMTVRTAPAYF